VRKRRSPLRRLKHRRNLLSKAGTAQRIGNILRDTRARLLLIATLILSTHVWAESATSPKPLIAPRPHWAESKTPETMRGRIIAGRLRAADGFSYFMTGISEQDMLKFNAQEVEVKAWSGVEVRGNRYTWRVQLVEPPRLIIPARWSAPLAAMLALIVIFPFVSRRPWAVYVAGAAPLVGLGVIVFYTMSLGQHGRERISEALFAALKVGILPVAALIVAGAIRKFDFKAVLAAAFYSFGLMLAASPALEHYTFDKPVPIGDMKVLAAACGVLMLFVVLPALLKPAKTVAPEVAQPKPEDVAQKV
jgi:hypothetical protein